MSVETLVAGLVVVTFGLATGTIFWLQWTGRGLRSRDPDAALGRSYLLAPLSLLATVFGVLLVLEGLGVSIPPGVGVPLLVVALLAGLAGLILGMWQPRWLRPAWQRRQVDARRARAGGAAGAGRYALEVVADGEPVPGSSGFVDLERAEAAARRALDTDPTAAYVRIVDTERGAAVVIVER